MRLVVVCDKCPTTIVVYRGNVQQIPFGMKLAEIIAIAYDEHRCQGDKHE